MGAAGDEATQVDASRPLAEAAGAPSLVQPQSVPARVPPRVLRRGKTTAINGSNSLPSANTPQNRVINGLPEYRSDLTLFKALLSWEGTILPLVVKTTTFWLLVASHGLFILLKKYGVFAIPDNDDDETAELSWAVIGVPTSLMVFFLVSPTV